MREHTRNYVQSAQDPDAARTAAHREPRHPIVRSPRERETRESTNGHTHTLAWRTHAHDDTERQEGTFNRLACACAWSHANLTVSQHRIRSAMPMKSASQIEARKASRRARPVGASVCNEWHSSWLRAPMCTSHTIVCLFTLRHGQDATRASVKGRPQSIWRSIWRELRRPVRPPFAASLTAFGIGGAP